MHKQSEAMNNDTDIPWFYLLIHFLNHCMNSFIKAIYCEPFHTDAAKLQRQRQINQGKTNQTQSKHHPSTFNVY